MVGADTNQRQADQMVTCDARLLVALPTGMLGAVFHGRWPDHGTRVLSLLGVSLPSFFRGLILIYVFSFQLGWLPTLGRGSWEHLVLPSVTLGTGLAAC